MDHVLKVLLDQCLRLFFVFVSSQNSRVLVSRMRNPSFPEVKFPMTTDPESGRVQL